MKISINKHIRSFLIIDATEINRSYFFINLSAFIISLIFFISFLIFSSDYPENNIACNIYYLFISFFLLFAPNLAIRIISALKRQKYSSYERYDPVIILLVFALLILISLFPFRTDLLAPVAFTGIFSAVIFFAQLAANKVIRKDSLMPLGIIILFSAFIVFSLWSSKFLLYYSSPIFYEKLFTGNAFIDPIFHGAVSNIFKNYHTPSTGLDGTPLLRYHFLSHWIFARLSGLTGSNALYFYQAGYPIIFIPLFFKYFLLMVRRISPSSGHAAFTKKYFWFAVLIVFSSIFPKFILERFFISNFEIVSESYNLSLTLSFIVILMIMLFAVRDNKNTPYNVTRMIFFLVLLPVFIFLIGLLKSSTMVIFVAVLAYVFIRLRLFRSFAYSSSIIFCLSSGFLLLRFLSGPGFAGYETGLFAFFRTVVLSRNPGLPWYIALAFFITVYYFWTLLFIIIKTIEIKKGGAAGPFTAFGNKKTLLLEIPVFALFAGILPGALFIIPGGSANYFSDIQRWISVILLLAFLVKTDFFIPFFSNTKRRAALIAAVSILFISFVFNFFTETDSFLRDYFRNKEEYGRIIEDDFAGDIERYRKMLIATLIELDKMPEQVKGNTLLYIPASNSIFWDLGFFSKTLSVPLAIPAVSGIAMIDGLPSRAQVYNMNFGYASYEVFEEVKYDKRIEDIFYEVKSGGYENLIVLDLKGGYTGLDLIDGSNIHEYAGNTFNLVRRLLSYTVSQEPEFEYIYEITERAAGQAGYLECLIADKLLTSDAIPDGMDNTEFINMIYRILLDREPDREGLEKWSALLEDGKPGIYILESIIDSPEFSSKYSN